MNFIYYVPQGGNADAIGYAFEGTPINRDVFAKGPDGGKGKILFDASMVSRMAAATHLPDKQTWRQIPGASAWVGHYTDDVPTPDDLKRSKMLPGHEIEMPDGNRWLIPVCRQYTNTGQFRVALPQMMDLDENGDWITDAVVSKHQALWDASCKWFDLMVATSEDTDGDVELLVSDVADSCVLALQTNYRVSRMEVAMLQLLTSTSRADVLNATIDLPAIEDQLKKKELAAA